MINYIKILELKDKGLSIRQIAKTGLASRSTVSYVINASERAGLVFPLDQNMTNEKLYGLLYPDKVATEYAPIDCEQIHNELSKVGVTLKLLWNEYVKMAKSSAKQPYKYVQFTKIYRAWAHSNAFTMRLTHKPGDAMQVDWAGATISYHDVYGKTHLKAYVFVASLPCSSYIYAEACPNMLSESFLMCHVHAYEFFGGVTRLLIPDNLKTGVISHKGSEFVLNKSYDELGAFYNTTIVPTRVKKPKDKATVERSVRVVEENIIAPLRNKDFLSIEEINEAIMPLLKAVNERPFSGDRKGSRYSAFINEEKPYLNELPIGQFEVSEWACAKVPRDYLISDKRNRYSVPYTLVGKTVMIRLSKNEVKVYNDEVCVATHQRLPVPTRDPIIIKEHMPPAHRAMYEYDPDYLRKWAEQQDPAIKDLALCILNAEKEPELCVRKCISLKKLVDSYSKDMIRYACDIVLQSDGIISIDALRHVLNNKKKTSSEPSESRRVDGLFRGSDYYD